MRKPFLQKVEQGRVNSHGPWRTNHGDTWGVFLVRLTTGAYALCVVSDGIDWPLQPPAFEHVSVSIRVAGQPANRCPTWEEMCEIKDLFWDAEELVVQYHPPKSQYVNRHPHCLHLWKPIGVAIPLPPRESVG